MKCTHCAFDNEPDAKFCENCGQPLEHTCPNCARPIAPQAKFCRHCGFRLRETPPRVPPARQPTDPLPNPPIGLQALMPDDLRAKLETARHDRSMQGERRIVTILFCDVKGSTALAEHFDPEEWAEVMNRVFEFLIRPVYRYEGTVARLMGDAILAFFGAPIAHEDDPQRALLAGLGIVESIQPLRAQLKRTRGLDFNVRVGINTGLVVVGEVGSDLKLEYTAMGDAVNLAARMEQTAQPGTVQIAASTHRLVAPLFEFESLGGIEIKGKDEPVAAYRVLRPKDRPGRLRGIEGLNAPLIGREREIDTLRHALAELRQGRGQIVSLIGEAGLGKSRLISELHSAWLASRLPDPHDHWSESRGISYDATHPYLLFQQHIRAMSGANESDAPRLVRDKLARLMNGNEQTNARRVFEVLLAVEPEDISDGPSPAAGVKLEGETLKRELFTVIEALLNNTAKHAPLVMVCDDVHWADSASVELLQHLFRLCDEAPILFLCAFRPDRQAVSWPVKQFAESNFPHRYTEIMLSPLSATDSNALVDSLLTIADLSPKLRERILQKTDGNPFFVEEVVRTLIDQGVVVRNETRTGWRATANIEDVAIPDNVQSLLVARMDRLAEDVRRTLQLAAVIGRSFYYRVLRLISQVEMELDQHLLVLQRADLIREATRKPELEYLFRHALTQEAAYNSILLRQRREFHRRVGETLETLFADRLEEHAPVLGNHFYEAGDARALKYYTLAGDLAYRLFAKTEAIVHFTRALECAHQHPDVSAPLEHLYTRRGRALEWDGQFDAAVANYEEMLRLGQERDDRQLELAALLTRGLLHSVVNSRHDPAQAEQLCLQALPLARVLGNRHAEARALGILMLCLASAGERAHEAISYGEQSLAIARELNQREQMAQTLNDLCWLHLTTGQLREGAAVNSEAQALWRELGNLPMLCDSLTSGAAIKFLGGDLDGAEALGSEELRLSQQINNLWGISAAYVWLAYVANERGEVSTVMRWREEGARAAEQVNNVSAQVALLPELGWNYAQLGNVEGGLALARQAVAIGEAKMRGWLPWAHGTLVRIYALRGSADDIAEAERLLPGVDIELVRPNFAPPGVVVFQAPVELALAKRDWPDAVLKTDALLNYLRHHNFRVFVPDALYLKSKALIAQGQTAEALDLLHEARTIAESYHSRRSLWPILLALSELKKESGEATQAETLRQQAAEQLRFIADHIEQPDLRASFLALPAVQVALK